MEQNHNLTAWEKMQLDMIYDDFDEDLFNRRVDAKNIFNRFNQTTDEQVEERNELLKQLFGSIGENVYVEPTFKCEFGKNIYIGNDVYINFGAVLLDCSRITIGNNVLMASHIFISDNSHGCYKGSENDSDPTIPPTQREYTTAPISIGDNTWIGEGVIIMPGVTIGMGCVIGAHSVVSKSIPDYCVAVGSPAKPIKKYDFKTKKWIKI